MLHVLLQPEQTTCWSIFNTETPPPWYPVKSFLGLIPMPFSIMWLTGTRGLSPHRFSKANPPGLSIQSVPQTCQGCSSSHAAQTTTDKFYQIMTQVDPRRHLFHQNGHYTPLLGWSTVAQNLQTLLVRVWLWALKPQRPHAYGMYANKQRLLTDKPNRLIRELLPLKNHQALKSQSKNTALKSICWGGDWRVTAS